MKEFQNKVDEPTMDKIQNRLKLHMFLSKLQLVCS